MDKAVVTVLNYLNYALRDPALMKNSQSDSQIHQLTSLQFSSNPGSFLLSGSKINQDDETAIVKLNMSK